MKQNFNINYSLAHYIADLKLWINWIHARQLLRTGIDVQGLAGSQLSSSVIEFLLEFNSNRSSFRTINPKASIQGTFEVLERLWILFLMILFLYKSLTISTLSTTHIRVNFHHILIHVALVLKLDGELNKVKNELNSTSLLKFMSYNYIIPRSVML
jgi:hypothetical protein